MMRYSRQRESVLQAVKGTNTHPTAEWVYGQVQPAIPNISLGTVYRNLNQLADGGAIQRIFDNGLVRYDGNTGRHDHFRCLSCRQIFDLRLPLENVTEHIHAEYGFSVSQYALEVTGICSHCLAENGQAHPKTNEMNEGE